MNNLDILSSNCESCVTKPCQMGCPLNNDITQFIKNVKNKEYEKAYRVLTNTSVLMPLCGRICPHYQQCQGSCVKGVSYDAVEIGVLEYTIGDMALDNNWTIPVKDTTNYKVAVIGGGPSGLTCAAFLRRNGINVTIYEKYDYLGGLLVHGIPAFRLSKDLVKRVTDSIVNLGIDVKYNTELGKDITLEELKNEYDAIYIAVGANRSNKMDIPGEDLDGVYGGNELLEHNINLDYINKNVVISGGGNVAMDVARTAKRSGASRVTVVYRRGRDEMPADKKEVEEVMKDGIEFIFQTNILKVIGSDKVTGIEVIKTELVQKEGETRLSPVNIEGSEYTIDCDYVMMAIGSHPDDFVSELNIETNKQGKIAIDRYGHTSDEKVFSGGDIAATKGTVAWASRAGRNAAYSIIDFLEK